RPGRAGAARRARAAPDRDGARLGAPGAPSPPRVRPDRGGRMTGPGGVATRRSAAEAVLRRRIEERTARCGVVGLGFIGATLLNAVAAAGFPACGVDRSAAVVDRFGADGGDAIAVSDDVAALAEADVVVVAVRVAPLPGGGMDLEP